MTLEFFMPMVPPTMTFQDKDLAVTKSGKPVMFDSAELKAVKAKLTGHLAQHRPERPLRGPVRLVIKWLFPLEGTDHFDGEWYEEKPDYDNLAKAPTDCMKRLGFFARDDCQVASGIVEKFWASTPGIYVRLEELT